MSKAVLCPVCNGKGYILIDCINIPCEKEHKTCHGCAGKGWVELGGDNICPYPVNPQIWWPQYPEPFSYTITYSDIKDKPQPDVN